MSEHSALAEREFGVSYFSEVSIWIKAHKEQRDDGQYLVFEARHPHDWPESKYYHEDHMTGLRESWFHFSDQTGPDELCIEKPVTADTERRTVLTILQELALYLYAGAVMCIHNQLGHDDPYNQMYNDLLYAFIIGGSVASGMHVPEDRWLEKL